MIEIENAVWIEERQDWQVDYVDNRNGTQKGRRYIELPETATEADIIEFIEGEGA